MKVVIAKIDAARRQLAEAIKLWFSEGDYVAIHSLVCSAHQIIHDINSRNGGRDLLYDSLIIKDEYRSKWVKRIKKEYNFFKHADTDSDPNCTIEFDTQTTEFFILFTLLGIELLGYKFNSIERAFYLFFMLTNPSLIKPEKKNESLRKFIREKNAILKKITKNNFLNYYSDLINNTNNGNSI